MDVQRSQITSAVRMDMMVGMPLHHLYSFVCHCLGRYWGSQGEPEVETMNPLLEWAVGRPGNIWRSQSCASV